MEKKDKNQDYLDAVKSVRDSIALLGIEYGSKVDVFVNRNWYTHLTFSSQRIINGTESLLATNADGTPLTFKIKPGVKIRRTIGRKH